MKEGCHCFKRGLQFRARIHHGQLWQTKLRKYLLVHLLGNSVRVDNFQWGVHNETGHALCHIKALILSI
jgi:hypothetical protein